MFDSTLYGSRQHEESSKLQRQTQWILIGVGILTATTTIVVALLLR